MDGKTLLDNIPEGLPEDVPIVMLNLLQWNENANYPQDSSHPPCTGREAYLQRYVPTFRPIAEKWGGSTVVYIGKPAATLVGPDEKKFDVVALVKYPNIGVFRRIVGSDEYKTNAAPHRIAALKEWRLVVTIENQV
ncbi:uncharacterized protein A1O9_11143 [Exophiala aquamarina CBS 119918]|uniref:Uncharacterized protein n=1 Tax=Exophiala aquamarina CBS 119918 TaxID=1182545 RepID=A0A072NYS8_9EURO|nr:uncharacterized protein A1O9_11143 [Exophiala aquamarina CBS 119918]KEF52726.1 hypothetical protein A1O9_11143 [Exophiala aquamarina CBS 119918]